MERRMERRKGMALAVARTEGRGMGHRLSGQKDPHMEGGTKRNGASTYGVPAGSASGGSSGGERKGSEGREGLSPGGTEPPSAASEKTREKRGVACCCAWGWCVRVGGVGGLGGRRALRRWLLPRPLRGRGASTHRRHACAACMHYASAWLLPRSKCNVYSHSSPCAAARAGLASGALDQRSFSAAPTSSPDSSRNSTPGPIREEVGWERDSQSRGAGGRAWIGATSTDLPKGRALRSMGPPLLLGVRSLWPVFGSFATYLGRESGSVCCGTP